jgi:hypothetical protein
MECILTKSRIMVEYSQLSGFYARRKGIMRLQVTNIKVDICSDVTVSIIWATKKVPKA